MAEINKVEEAFVKLDEYILSTTNVPITEHSVQVRNVYNRIKRYVEVMDLSKSTSSKMVLVYNVIYITHLLWH